MEKNLSQAKVPYVIRPVEDTLRARVAALECELAGIPEQTKQLKEELKKVKIELIVAEKEAKVRDLRKRGNLLMEDRRVMANIMAYYRRSDAWKASEEELKHFCQYVNSRIAALTAEIEEISRVVALTAETKKTREELGDE